MRADLEIIQEWIPANSRVLDLGCGDGELLSWLQKNKNVTGYGLEIDPDNIAACIDKRATVMVLSLDSALGDPASTALAAVVRPQALQAVHDPDTNVQEMPGPGRACISTWPPAHHCRCGWYLAHVVRIPISD